jgi:hypothetical protein
MKKLLFAAAITSFLFICSCRKENVNPVNNTVNTEIRSIGPSALPDGKPVH